MTTLAAFLLPLFLGGPSLGTPPGEHVSAAAMWTQEAEFTTPIEEDLDFGSLVALGPATIAAAGQVGAASMVYVYDRAAGAWAEPAQLSFPEDILIRAVGLSGDDMVTLVTYTAAYTSERLESGWSEPHTVLTIPDGDLFGRVHITDDVMVLGTYESSGPCTQQARIRVFRRAGQAWAADGEAVAADCADESTVHFGLAADGDRLVSIMAGEEAQDGVARVYRRSGEATSEIETTLEAPSIAADGRYTEVAIQGDTLVLGAQYANDERGRADVYVERGDGWHLQQSIHGVGEGNKLIANGGWFGALLAIDGDLLAIGSPNESSPNENSEGLLQSRHGPYLRLRRRMGRGGLPVPPRARQGLWHRPRPALGAGSSSARVGSTSPAATASTSSPARAMHRQACASTTANAAPAPALTASACQRTTTTTRNFVHHVAAGPKRFDKGRGKTLFLKQCRPVQRTKVGQVDGLLRF